MYTLNGVSTRVTVTVVVPVLNEAANLPALFASLPAVYEVLVVDGKSVDGTCDVVERTVALGANSAPNRTRQG